MEPITVTVTRKRQIRGCFSPLWIVTGVEREAFARRHGLRTDFYELRRDLHVPSDEIDAKKLDAAGHRIKNGETVELTTDGGRPALFVCTRGGVLSNEIVVGTGNSDAKMVVLCWTGVPLFTACPLLQIPGAVSLRKIARVDVGRVARLTRTPRREVERMLADADAETHDGRFFAAYVIAEGNRTAGVITLYERSEGVISIGPEVFRRFRRRGIATKAMRQAIGLARERGYHTVLQEVRLDNPASVALHEKCGFETDGRTIKTRKEKDARLYVKNI